MLWGRYWGSEKNIDYLHFEACYYSPIEWAIKNKILYGFESKEHFVHLTDLEIYNKLVKNN